MELAGWLDGGRLAGGLVGWLAEAQTGPERPREAQSGTEGAWIEQACRVLGWGLPTSRLTTRETIGPLDRPSDHWTNHLTIGPTTGPKRPRDAQRGPERPREAQRGPERPREAQRVPERPREAKRSPERLREAQRGPERPICSG